MHGTRGSVNELVAAIKKRGDLSCEVLICPPFVYLQQVGSLIDGSPIKLGAQNVDWRAEGAFTGEISASMVREFGCSYVLVGHSERRTLFHESDETVAAKFKAVAAAGLTPILCVGETLEQRQAGETRKIVGEQIQAVMRATEIREFAAAVLAYEPVWAIGTGETATPEIAAKVHGDIRKIISEADGNLANGMRILYGGSVNVGNASVLMHEQDIDGALVGGASLKSDDFIAICEMAGAI